MVLLYTLEYYRIVQIKQGFFVLPNLCRLLCIKKATFDFPKKNLGPFNLLTKTDKWDYLQCSIIDFFVSCFDIGELPRSAKK